jgi:hypothetical protein
LRREDYGTHSLRRTKASIIYKATGNLRAVQLLLGHAKIEVCGSLPLGRTRPNTGIGRTTAGSRKRTFGATWFGQFRALFPAKGPSLWK